jgi:hypothetical protein
MQLICVCWSEKFGGDLLALPWIEMVRHPVKELRIKQHGKPKDGTIGAGGDARTEAEEGEDLDSGDGDFVPEKKKGW